MQELRDSVETVSAELTEHNARRTLMDKAYLPMSPNHTKAMRNWQRKSSYLLGEYVRYQKYIDVLETYRA